jgi:hypothetical protein
MLAGRRQNDDFSGGDQSEEINLVEYGDVEDKKMILVTVRRQRRGSCDTDTGRAIPGERYRARIPSSRPKYVCTYQNRTLEPHGVGMLSTGTEPTSVSLIPILQFSLIPRRTKRGLNIYVTLTKLRVSRHNIFPQLRCDKLYPRSSSF